MNDLDRALERIRQGRQARTRELAASLARSGASGEQSGAPFSPGARVFDRVTGLEGEIIGGSVETVLIQPAERAEG